MATSAYGGDKIEIGRVVQQGLQVIGANLGAYLGIGLLLSGLPSAMMNWILLDRQAMGGGITGGTPIYVAVWLLAILGGYLVQAAIVRSSILQLSGANPDIAGSLGVALKFVLPMIGLAILTSILTGIGMVLLIVPGIIVYIMLIVSVPALVEERGGVIHSMRRSRELTKGSRGRIFLLLLLFVIVYFVMLGVVGAIAAALFSEMGPVTAVLQGLSAAVTSVLVAGMLAALYVELRSVKEGATVQSLADIFA